MVNNISLLLDYVIKQLIKC